MEKTGDSAALLSRRTRQPRAAWVEQRIYREHGVSWLWFVDPSARTIEVLNRDERGWMVTGAFGGEGEARIPPFDAVAFDIGALWDVNSPVGSVQPSRL